MNWPPGVTCGKAPNSAICAATPEVMSMLPPPRVRPQGPALPEVWSFARIMAVSCWKGLRLVPSRGVLGLTDYQMRRREEILPRPRPETPFAPGPVETIAPCALMSATSAARVKAVAINCIVVMNLRFGYGQIEERGLSFIFSKFARTVSRISLVA